MSGLRPRQSAVPAFVQPPQDTKEIALQRLTSAENTAVGLASGVVDVSTTQWMLYCKNATQQRLPLTLDPRFLYRGYVVSVSNMSILSGLQFPLTALVTSVITKGEQRRLTDGEQIGAAFVGGALSGLVGGPMELVMIQQQRFGTSLISTPAKVIKEASGSPLGLFRGLPMTMGREGVFTAGMLGLGPSLKRYLIEEQGLSTGAASILGAIGAGVTVGTISHPMDTMKTCQQGDIRGAQYGSVGQTARALMSEAGLVRFFSGWPWRTGRMCIQAFLFDACNNHLSPLFFPHHFKHLT